MKVILTNSNLVFATKKPYQPNEFTRNAILASGNTSMTESQVKALEQFFNTIGATSNSGIWSKVDKIYLPIIASSVSKAIVNYKGNSVDATPSNGWVLVNNGLKYNGSNPSDVISSADTIAVSSTDLSMFVMTMEDYRGSENKMMFADLRYNASDKGNKTFYVTSSKVAVGLAEDNGKRCNLFRSGANKKGIHGFSSGSDYAYVVYNEVSSVDSFLTERNALDLSDVDTQVQKHVFIPSTSGATSGMPSFGVMLIGKAVTSSEWATLRTAINSLRTAFVG